MKNVVAIIGKPNVGKSTLFNKIISKRKSIVFDEPGVTRDRLYEEAYWSGHKFKLIDTGGITIEENDFKKLIKVQAQIAIDESNVIIFILNGKEELTTEDYYISDLLRKSGKKIIVAINKLDGETYIEPSIYKLGYENVFPISAIHGNGIGNLLDEVLNNLNINEDQNNQENIFKLTLLGKPNVGKSTILNLLTNENRSIVSNIAGTTRDSVSSIITINNEKFEIIDTAGIKRKSILLYSIEHYSLIRANNSLEEADLCLLILDATEDVTLFQQNIIGLAYEQKKPLIIVVNKWDLIDKNSETMDKYKKDLLKKLKFVDWAPIVFISALNNKRINKLKDLIFEVKTNISRMINTNQLNQLIITAQIIKPASSIHGHKLSIKFIKQVQTKIPTFLLFVNNKKLAHFTYLRYIENQIRQNYNFSGTPIELILKNKNGDD